jgi:hypothetical protein
MPERIAIHKLTIGGEKGERKDVMPGVRFTCDSATAAELDSHFPPAVRKVGSEAPPASADSENSIARRVAEPVDLSQTDGARAATQAEDARRADARSNENVTRGELAANAEDEGEL